MIFASNAIVSGWKPDLLERVHHLAGDRLAS